MSHPFQPLLEVDLDSRTTKATTVPDTLRRQWLGGSRLGLQELTEATG